jgi:5-formyltetrahydrofolate cyclo-ligase
MRLVWQQQMPNKNHFQQQLALRLNEFLQSQIGQWASYSALNDEPNPNDICEKNKQLQWCYPRIVGEHEMQMHLVLADRQNWRRNQFGVLEPSGKTALVLPEQLVGFLVPGLVFNKNGVRLGRGKGFYDRYLSQSRGIKVGLCFSFQFLNKEIPHEAHDVRMDFIITDQEIYKCN